MTDQVAFVHSRLAFAILLVVGAFAPLALFGTAMIVHRQFAPLLLLVSVPWLAIGLVAASRSLTILTPAHMRFGIGLVRTLNRDDVRGFELERTINGFMLNAETSNSGLVSICHYPIFFAAGTDFPDAKVSAWCARHERWAPSGSGVLADIARNEAGVRRFVMRPEYGGGPLWDDEWDGVADLCPDVESFGLSPHLTSELLLWQAEYVATLDHSYPPDSDFPSEAVRAQWDQRGHDLFDRLTQEVGDRMSIRLDLS